MATQKKHSKKIYFYLMGVCALVFCISVSLMLWPRNTKQESTQVENDYHTVTINNQNYTYNSDIISILFFGIDVTKQAENGQADSIQVLLINRKTKKLQIITIPRDTMTEIEFFDFDGNSLGWKKHHLNLQNAYANTRELGATRTMNAVSRLFNNIPFSYYASMDLSALPKIQSVVGDLTVTLPDNTLSKVYSGWTKGKQVVINQTNVEKFVRYRDTKINFSAKTRNDRQAVYMNAYQSKLKELLKKDFDNTLKKLYQVVSTITTNISYDNLLSICEYIQSYQTDEKDYVLPGKYKMGIHDEYHINKNQVLEFVLKLFYTKDK